MACAVEYHLPMWGELEHLRQSPHHIPLPTLQLHCAVMLQEQIPLKNENYINGCYYFLFIHPIWYIHTFLLVCAHNKNLPTLQLYHTIVLRKHMPLNNVNWFQRLFVIYKKNNSFEDVRRPWAHLRSKTLNQDLWLLGGIFALESLDNGSIVISNWT